jgi:hypothetical protein
MIGNTATNSIDVEFDEFRLFHQLKSLSLNSQYLRLCNLETCFPAGLDRLPNLTSLYVPFVYKQIFYVIP